MKADVLADLPPKITQDYYCHLSPVQTALYEDFARSQARDATTGQPAQSSHVFQALQYLKKVSSSFSISNNRNSVTATISSLLFQTCLSSWCSFVFRYAITHGWC